MAPLGQSLADQKRRCLSVDSPTPQRKTTLEMGFRVARGGEIHEAARAGQVERIQALVKQHPELLRAKDE